jgi:hypothetical protein
VTSFYQQIHGAKLSFTNDELFLHLIEVVKSHIFGRRRRRGEKGALGGTLVETLKPRVVDELAD